MGKITWMNPLMMNKIHYSRIFPSFISAQTILSCDFSLEDSLSGMSSQQESWVEEEFGDVDVVTMRQVHGNDVLMVDDAAMNISEADAVISRRKKALLTVRTADCLPVFLVDARNEAVGLVHAGWKGTRLQICMKTVLMMKEEYGTDLSQLQVAFGPCIRKGSYSVGSEFSEFFPDEVEERDGKLWFDLALANKRQLLRAGVSEKNLWDCEIDTFRHRGCSSYRRDGDQAGRMLSGIVLNS